MAHHVVTKVSINVLMAFVDRLAVTTNWIPMLNWINAEFAMAIMVHAMILLAISDPNKLKLQNNTAKHRITTM